MGSNDTLNLGLRRPFDGCTDWGEDSQSGEDLNHNFTLLDSILFPSDISGTHQLRVVAQSFEGLSLPTGTTKLFSSINEAIEDVPTNLETLSEIAVFPGSYSEEILIQDRSVHVYGLPPYHGSASAGDSVLIRSNSSSSTATGRPCITIDLRKGIDETHPSGQTPAQLWALPQHEHVTRGSKKIVFSNIFFDNQGKYYLNEDHDVDTCYYLDIKDGGVPPYYGRYTWLVFNNCVFRGQTWRDKSIDGNHIVGWYQKGFNIKAYAVVCRFMHSIYACYNYAGGTNGTQYFPSICQPFKIGTDGSSFIGWYMGPPGSSTASIRYDGNRDSAYRGYYYNKSSVRFMASDFVASEKHGVVGSWAPPGYSGTGWWYGHGSDSSCALVTVYNMGNFYARGSTFYPAAWGDLSSYDYGPASGAAYANYYHKYTDPGSNASVVADVESTGQDVTACTVEGLVLDGVALTGNIVLNSFGVSIGGSSVRDAG